jgi:hypothetical protein
VIGDVHDGEARCGSVTGASRFLIGLVTCFATHDGIPANIATVVLASLLANRALAAEKKPSQRKLMATVSKGHATILC